MVAVRCRRRRAIARWTPLRSRIFEVGCGSLYLNFAGFGEEKEAMLRDAYGQNYDRLVALKTRYDPGNLFRMNLNIPPAASVASA